MLRAQGYIESRRAGVAEPDLGQTIEIGKLHHPFSGHVHLPAAAKSTLS